MITVLQEGTAREGFKPGSLDFDLQVTPASGFDRTQYVHHLLLQKNNGDFYLLLWHEISNEDTKDTPHRQLNPPPMPATLTLPASIRSAALYAPNENVSAKQLLIADRKIHLQIQDTVMIVQLVRDIDSVKGK